MRGREGHTDRRGWSWGGQQSTSPLLHLHSPSKRGAVLNGLAATCPITGAPDQCRRRRRWEQEEGKDASSRSAHAHLAQKNRVPLVRQWLKMTFGLFQAREKRTLFSGHLNFAVGGSVDGKKCTYSIELNSISVWPAKIPGNKIQTHALDALGERVHVLFY